MDLSRKGQADVRRDGETHCSAIIKRCLSGCKPWLVTVSIFQIFFILLLSVPLLEIYFLIQVGQVIGGLWTIAVVIFTALLGAHLLRQQGISTFARFQQSTQSGKLPATELIEGLILLICGALLLTPGFVTDGVGFLLLIPVVRRAVAGALLARVKGQLVVSAMNANYSAGPRPEDRPPPSGGTTIDGEYRKE